MNLCHNPATLANNPGVVQAFHKVALYFPQLRRVSPWDNMASDFVGNLVVQQIQNFVVLGDVLSGGICSPDDSGV